jgi:peptidoglycan/LPS O-acetylase OafA/YrhL
MVFVSHIWFLKDESPFMKQLYDDIFYEGYIGVSFFFILSGFVLAYSYHHKILSGEVKFSQFWLARFARIYPLHLLTLMIAVPLSLGGDATEWINRLVLNIFLIQSFVPSDDIYFYFNSVSWSISDEWFFYLMFPFLVFFMLRRRYLKFLPFILLLIPISLFLVKESYHEKYFYINPLLRLGDFLLGKLLFRLYNKRRDIEILNNTRVATIVEVGSILFLAIFLYYHKNIPQGFRYSCYYWPPMILLIYTFAYSKGLVSKMLSNKVLVYLGEISFGFYMIHMLVLRYYQYIPKKIPALAGILPTNHNAAFIILGISLAASMFLYKYYEKPANSFIKKKLGPRL